MKKGESKKPENKTKGKAGTKPKDEPKQNHERSTMEIQKLVGAKLGNILPKMMSATVEDNAQTSCAVNVSLVPDEKVETTSKYKLKVTAKMTIGDEVEEFSCETNEDKQLLIQFQE